MADTTPHLAALRAGITRLAQLADSAHEAEARHLADALQAELDQAFPAAAPAANASGLATPSKPRHEVLRCPRCSLRTFTFEPGTLRRADTDTGHEARFHCLSCGHRDWHEAD